MSRRSASTTRIERPSGAHWTDSGVPNAVVLRTAVPVPSAAAVTRSKRPVSAGTWRRNARRDPSLENCGLRSMSGVVTTARTVSLAGSPV